MGRKSSIKRLPPKVLKAVNDALRSESTIDEVVAKIEELGAEASRSSVARYKRNFDKVTAQIRQSQEIAEVLVKELGPNAAEGTTGRALVQVLQSIVFKVLLPQAENEDPDVAAKDLHYLARTLKDMASATKIDLDRELKIREAVKAEMAEKAKKAAASSKTALSKAGLSDDTIKTVEEQILGIVR